MLRFSIEHTEALRELLPVWPGARLVVHGAAALRACMGSLWRPTKDLNLLVSASRKDVTDVLSRLPGWSADPRRSCRWRSPAGAVVDIILAGREALAKGYVQRTEAGFHMSTVGIRLAFEHAVRQWVWHDLEIDVAPIHVVAMLKMIAYLDRQETRLKDLGDLAHILGRHVGAGDPSRGLSRGMPVDMTEYDEVSPYFLGRDLGALVDTEERRHVWAFVEALENEERRADLISIMPIMGSTRWVDPDHFLMMLHAFRRGFSAVEGPA